MITGIYVTSMALFASIGAGSQLSAGCGGMGWKISLRYLAGIALLAILAWLPQRKLGGPMERQRPQYKKSVHTHRRPSGNHRWLVHYAVFRASISQLYSLTAWIPSILQSNGMAPEQQATCALVSLIGIPASFLVPVLAARVKSQRIIVAGAVPLIFSGLPCWFSYILPRRFDLSLMFLSGAAPLHSAGQWLCSA